MPVAHLYPRSPYDFSLSAAIFVRSDPQIRTYEHDIFRQVLDIGGNPALVEVFSEGSADRPKLRSLRSNRSRIYLGWKQLFEKHIRYLF